MIISERISSLSASPIRKLNPYAAAAKAAGKKVYHLNIGQPDIETPAGFLDAIRRFDKKSSPTATRTAIRDCSKRSAPIIRAGTWITTSDRSPSPTAARKRC